MSDTGHQFLSLLFNFPSTRERGKIFSPSARVLLRSTLPKIRLLDLLHAALALSAQPARNPDYRPSVNPLLARSRLTGLRTFFSQALPAPKKVPPPSAHSRYEQPEYPQFRQIKQPSAISIVFPHSGQVTVLTSPDGLYSSISSFISSAFASSGFFLSSRFIGWN